MYPVFVLKNLLFSIKFYKIERKKNLQKIYPPILFTKQSFIFSKISSRFNKLATLAKNFINFYRNFRKLDKTIKCEFFHKKKTLGDLKLFFCNKI